MTVTQENLPYLWQAIEFGLQFPHVRGISFQPMFQSGRIPLKRAKPQPNTPSPPSEGGEADEKGIFDVISVYQFIPKRFSTTTPESLEDQFLETVLS